MERHPCRVEGTEIVCFFEILMIYPFNPLSDCCSNFQFSKSCQKARNYFNAFAGNTVIGTLTYKTSHTKPSATVRSITVLVITVPVITDPAITVLEVAELVEAPK